MTRNVEKLTKIIATIGPSSDSAEKIEELIRAGVNVFRFNFKHNTVDWHSERIHRVTSVIQKMGVFVGMLIDLQGPEIRIKMLSDNIKVTHGMRILLDEMSYIEKNTQITAISITHPGIIAHLKQGQHVIADDGSFEFTIEREGGKTYLVSKSDGILKTNKTLNIPGADFPFPTLIDRDFEGLKLARLREVDFVALSFVRSGLDVKILRQEMKKLGVDSKIVSKIETKKAIDCLDDIIKESDGIMVARGDLAVEAAYEQVPSLQKKIIKKCVEAGKFVITATQMLESMIDHPYPTRAEVSDIANAVYDDTSAVMLSGETATGLFSTEAVAIMSKTAAYNECAFNVDLRYTHEYSLHGVDGILCEAAYDLYHSSKLLKEHIKGFIVLTHTGRTPRLLSRYRPRLPLYTFCPSKKVASSLTIEFGVIPFVQDARHISEQEVTGENVRTAMHYLVKQGFATKGDSFIVLHGDRWAVTGGTSTVKIVTC